MLHVNDCTRLEVKYFEKYLNTNTNTLKVSNTKYKYKYLYQGCISNTSKCFFKYVLLNFDLNYTSYTTTQHICYNCLKTIGIDLLLFLDDILRLL